MNNLIAATIIMTTYFVWGYWLLGRRDNQNDIDIAFLWSIVPVAAMTWLAMFILGKDFPF